MIKKLIIKVSEIFLILEMGLSLPIILFMYFTYTEHLSIILIVLTIISTIILMKWGEN